MASVTLSLPNVFKSELKHFSWINWSSIAREELMKKKIFEEYIATGTLTDKDWKFCKEIDWHPVDKLPLREEFKKELKQRRKGPFIKLRSVEEIFEE